jgi:hypothetical protein
LCKPPCLARYLRRIMRKTFTFKIEDIDLFQLLDGLEVRAESWERTAEYLRTEKMPENEIFIIEECSKPEEAEQIANHYRSIIAKIRAQLEEG